MLHPPLEWYLLFPRFWRFTQTEGENLGLNRFLNLELFLPVSSLANSANPSLNLSLSEEDQKNTKKTEKRITTKEYLDQRLEYLNGPLSDEEEPVVRKKAGGPKKTGGAAAASSRRRVSSSDEEESFPSPPKFPSGEPTQPWGDAHAAGAALGKIVTRFSHPHTSRQSCMHLSHTHCMVPTLSIHRPPHNMTTTPHPVTGTRPRH